MKFEEFHAGQLIDAGSVTVSEEQIIAFAREFDPQWFHIDPQRAASKPLERADRKRLAYVLPGDEARRRQRACRLGVFRFARPDRL